MVASGAAWLAVTSAPFVTDERPMRPEIGRGHLGVGEIDARGFERGLGGFDFRFGEFHRGDGIIIVLPADGLARPAVPCNDPP